MVRCVDRNGLLGMELIQVLYVSRHGLRNYGTLYDFTAYSPLQFPTHEAWGMTENSYLHQQLTPHGRIIMSNIGSYYAEKFLFDGFDVVHDCGNIVCYADDSSRDIDSAKLWLKGFGCSHIPVNIVNSTHNSQLRPVVYDLYDSGCPIATEEQVLGILGGPVAALSMMFATSINLIMNVIEMPSNASICSLSDPSFDSSKNCTLFDTGYHWTGYVYDGGFKCPTYYSRYFAEYFMLQYLNNLTDWGFGKLTPQELLDINKMHVKTHDLGANLWNSLSYGSEQLGYLLASMDQMITGKIHPGCHQNVDTNLVLLFSHDANILYLRKLLDLTWIPSGYTEGVADPGGALIFELWKEENTYAVRIHYDIPSPNQQRHAEHLNLENPPSVSEVIIPNCGTVYCPWEQFKTIVMSKIDLKCIQEPLRSTLQSIISSSSRNSRADDDDNLFASPLEILFISILSILSSLLAIACILYSKGYRLRHVPSPQYRRLIEIGESKSSYV